MWQDKLKEIIYILENSNVNEIEVNFWGRKYRVKKNPDLSNLRNEKEAVNSDLIPTEVKNYIASPSEPVSKSNSKKIVAPMPGTYYESPTPEDPPFVKIGDNVKKGQVLCIIEAMKIMNEIECDDDGKIIDILVQNSDPVEYNQPLYIIDPF
tara:strand:- start:53974 stop:54429 length:456 start_codon:yes stop_codon:yes gene_type:complete